MTNYRRFHFQVEVYLNKALKVPGLFYKGRSQEKKPPLRLQLFFLRSPLK